MDYVGMVTCDRLNCIQLYNIYAFAQIMIWTCFDTSNCAVLQRSKSVMCKSLGNDQINISFFLFVIQFLPVILEKQYVLHESDYTAKPKQGKLSQQMLILVFVSPSCRFHSNYVVNVSDGIVVVNSV